MFDIIYSGARLYQNKSTLTVARRVGAVRGMHRICPQQEAGWRSSHLEVWLLSHQDAKPPLDVDTVLGVLVVGREAG
jgi:hypothetical protein